MNQTVHLLLACSALALLTFGVGIRMLLMRVREMKASRIHPQSVALSAQRSTAFQDSRASDNYNHLFELPVLFYGLCALAVASQVIPAWLPWAAWAAWAAWAFVVSRYVHSVVQCSYNKVMHRFLIFVIGFVLLALMWIGFLFSFFLA